MTPQDITIIGIGNDLRGDDGVGIVVAGELARANIAGTQVCTSGGEATELLELWTDKDFVIIIDALVCSPAHPGKLHVVALEQTAAEHSTASSHAVGLAAAWRLGQALERLPERLMVIGIEAAEVGFGAPLSPAVAQAVPRAVAAIRREIEHARSRNGGAHS